MGRLLFLGFAGFSRTHELLDDEQYAQNQKRKLEDYAAKRIQEKKNLLITKEHFTTNSRDPKRKRACIDLREIVLQLISFDNVSP